MKIIELHAENIKKLIAVDIRPDSNLVQITGRNGQGKTSTLDCIWWAISGGRSIQTSPIRSGAEKAVIKLDLGEIHITRTFNRQEDGGFTTGLKVVAANGSRFDKPQDVLNTLLGTLSMDPLKFLRASPADQFDMAKAFVPDFDFVANTKARKAAFDERTDVNRRAKEKRSLADAIVLPPGAIPKAVDPSKLQTQLGEAAQFNSDLATRKARREAAVRDRDRTIQERDRLRALAEDLRQQAADLDAQADSQNSVVTQLEEQLANAEALPDPIDIAAIQDLLSRAAETNALAAKGEQRKAANTEADELEAKALALTKTIDAADKAKEKAIAAAEMPVHGLSFGDEEVLLDGQPFEQASDAQQLRTSIAIAAALNPKLRVIRVREGSLLDDQAMALLDAFADEHDVQIWIERVGSGPVGFELENGMLKSDTEEAV